jgi:DNA-directed RNA polymerase specialized sigma24 family protein
MPARLFPTTRWSLIRSSAGGNDAQADAALSELCRVYWYPVYVFIRIRGAPADDAQDLAQEFFVHLLTRRFFAAAQPEGGRFRAFLAVSLKNFLTDQTERRGAQKRGGGLTMVPIDLSGAEERFSHEPVHAETPERIFDRQWALALVSQTYDQLREALNREGRGTLFQHLQAFLPGGDDPSASANLPRDLGMTENAIKVAIHRLRRRYRELLRANVSHTLSDPGKVDDEIRFLLSSLSKER